MQGALPRINLYSKSRETYFWWSFRCHVIRLWPNVRWLSFHFKYFISDRENVTLLLPPLYHAPLPFPVSVCVLVRFFSLPSTAACTKLNLFRIQTLNKDAIEIGYTFDFPADIWLYYIPILNITMRFFALLCCHIPRVRSCSFTSLCATLCVAVLEHARLARFYHSQEKCFRMGPDLFIIFERKRSEREESKSDHAEEKEGKT